MTAPALYAIFHRNISGDDALLRLFQARFKAAGLGAEIYPADLAEAMRVWPLVPRSPPAMVHLPRTWDVFVEADRQAILAMADGLSGRVRGLVLHDRGDWYARRGELRAALSTLEHRLDERHDPTLIFLEYAAGLELDHYAQLIEEALPLPHVSACIDTGHVTVFTARAVLHELAPEVNPDDPGTLDRVPRDHLVSAVDTAEGQARDALRALAERLSRLAKPMHVHLHDGHLFSRWSLFPVSDHAPIGWEAEPARNGRPLLGQNGVADFLRALLAHGASEQISITLEVHPGRQQERLPLGLFKPLFAHWSDLSQAEMTNAWIELLLAQQNLVRRIAEQVTRDQNR